MYSQITMKFNLTVVLTLILLTLMLGASCVSGMWAFAIGHEALKGVNQPDVRPTKKMKGPKGWSSQPGALTLLKEEDIVSSVKAWIDAKGKHAKPQKPQEADKKSSSKQAQTQQTQLAAAESPQPGFPIATQNQGVKLEVLSARYAGGSLLMKLNFKNEGSKAVRFLYSFLDVTDDRGRPLSASTEGLPAELPANGQSFSGTVSIPATFLDDVKKLSLSLTDYPEQKLRLQMAEIPVNR